MKVFFHQDELATVLRVAHALSKPKESGPLPDGVVETLVREARVHNQLELSWAWGRYVGLTFWGVNANETDWHIEDTGDWPGHTQQQRQDLLDLIRTLS